MWSLCYRSNGQAQHLCRYVTTVVRTVRLDEFFKSLLIFRKKYFFKIFLKIFFLLGGLGEIFRFRDLNFWIPSHRLPYSIGYLTVAIVIARHCQLNKKVNVLTVWKRFDYVWYTLWSDIKQNTPKFWIIFY